MNIHFEYKSNIVSRKERIVRVINAQEQLVEQNGHYYIKTEGELPHYRGVDSRYDDIETILTIKRGE